MKKTAILFLSVLLLLSFSSCEKAKSTDLDALKSAMLSADSSLPDMSQVSDESKNASALFAYLSDMDYSAVSGYFFCYASEGTAEEIAVIEVGSTNNLQTAVNSLKTHAANRANMFRTYAPDQVQAAENALIFSNGRLAVLIISANQSNIKTEFDKFIKQ